MILQSCSFHHADRFLIRDDETSKADALVILMGSVADRVLQTADLYNAGYSSRIIIVEEYMQGIDSLLVRGIEVKSNAEICSDYLNVLGVPGKAITTLPGKAKSTREEAEIISKYLTAQPEIKSLIIVSSPFHTRRALLIFRKALTCLIHAFSLVQMQGVGTRRHSCLFQGFRNEADALK